MWIHYDEFRSYITIDENDELVGDIELPFETIRIRGRTPAEIKADFAKNIKEYNAYYAPDRNGMIFNQNLRSFHDEMIASIEMAKMDTNVYPFWPPESVETHSWFYYARSNALGINGKKLLNSDHTVIPKSLRLPIDDIINELRARRRHPKVHDFWTAAPQRQELNWYVRHGLWTAFRAVGSGDPNYRKIRLKLIRNFQSDAKIIRNNCEGFINKYSDCRNLRLVQSSKKRPELDRERNQALKLASYFLQSFLSCLEDIERTTKEEVEHVAPNRGGRPQHAWKYEFIASMATLWHHITGLKVAPTPSEIFVRFVEAGWVCGGDDLPEVSWEDAIRTWGRLRRRGKNYPPDVARFYPPPR